VTLAMGCGHVVHPAAVTPGPTIDVLPGAAVVRHVPRPDSYTAALREFEPFHSVDRVLQLNLGYGWRLSRHLGLQVLASAGLTTAPTLAPYVQIVGHPFDLGVGLTASLSGRSGHGLVPGSYVLAGKERTGDDGGVLRIDAGFRWLRIHDGKQWQQGFGPMGLLSLRHGRFAVGVWADYQHLTGPVWRTMCDDICRPEDLSGGAVGLGGFLRVIGFGRGAR
jgi:hypothetical protein